MKNQHTNPEHNQDLVLRGQTALREALGFDGAMQFMQQLNAQQDTPLDKCDGVKRVGAQVVTRQENEVIVEFTRDTRWVRFSAAEADAFADEVKRIAARSRRVRD